MQQEPKSETALYDSKNGSLSKTPSDISKENKPKTRLKAEPINKKLN